MEGDPGSFLTLIIGGGPLRPLNLRSSASVLKSGEYGRTTHELGELLPFEFDLSTIATFSAEPGEPLLRARLGAGSTRSALGGAEGALAMEVKWRGET